MPFRALIAILVLLALPLSARAQTDPRAPEGPRYLLPVFVTVPGAHGSMFITDFALFSPAFPIQVEGLRLACVTLCPPDRSLLQTIAAGETVQSFERTGRPGLLIKGNVDLQMNLRVRDTSRNSLSAGTEIPVISEAEMSAGPLYLVSVPPEGSTFRNRVRVYSFTPGQVKITHIRSADNAVLRVTTLELRFPEGVAPAEQEYYPAFAESADFPIAGSVTRVQVEPITNIGKLWAFITTTNNDSQEITIVTPQP